eukprot:GILK01002733.1.p1 GENE.GILK01002733.1~~GILK01002733.1.p1  ORF type:complete len:871 (-),score=95.60 GILK01002733.1:101-2677(-)
MAVGEVLLCDRNSSGEFHVVQQFLGQPLYGVTGSQSVLAVITGHKGENSTVLYQENDAEVQDWNHLLGGIHQTANGKHHALILTAKGEVWVMGGGSFGVAGLGGAASTDVPTIVHTLKERFIKQVACGHFHSLALTDKGDLYAWGRGTSGQLGVRKGSDVETVPRFLNCFSGIAIQAVACGAAHSLALSEDGRVFSWGEGTSGQLGYGLVSKEVSPKCIANLNDVRTISAGWAHSAASTVAGELYCWGLNVYGQLGTGDYKPRYEPTRISPFAVQSDVACNDVVCGPNFTFAISGCGELYSWGCADDKVLGYAQEGNGHSLVPRPVGGKLEGRVVTSLACANKQVMCFAPAQLKSVEPPCGPCEGGTSVALRGTGFCTTSNIFVYFIHGDSQVMVPGTYDPEEDAIYCQSPAMDGEEPFNVTIQLTLDGETIVNGGVNYQYYFPSPKLNAVTPKAGPASGNTSLVLTCTCNEETDFSRLTVRFSGIPKEQKVAANKMKVSQDQLQGKFGPHVEYDVRATYKNGRIYCVTPPVDAVWATNYVFSVDVSVNGQQFSQEPLPFRFYDVQLSELCPSNGPVTGDTFLRISATNLFDSSIKKVKFLSKTGEERVVVAQYDRESSQLICSIPPLSWFSSVSAIDVSSKAENDVQDNAPEMESAAALGTAQNPIPPATATALTPNGDAAAEPVVPEPDPIRDIEMEVQVSLNGQQFTEPGLTYHYYDVNISELVFAPKEEPKEGEPKPPADVDMTKSRQKGTKLELTGTGLRPSENWGLRLLVGASSSLAVDIPAVYVESKRCICAELPDLTGSAIPFGVHPTTIQFTLNGHNYSSTPLSFPLDFPDPAAPVVDDTPAPVKKGRK